MGLRTLLPARAAAAAAGLALVFPQWTQFDVSFESRAYARASHDFNEKRWVALGRHFAAQLPAETTLALSPIGAIGWHSRLEIVDILGLTNASAIGVEPDTEGTWMKGHHRSNASFVLDAAPDLVLLGNGARDPEQGTPLISTWEHELVLHPRFRAGYTQVTWPVPGGAPVDLFVRNGAAPPPGAIPR